MKTLIFVLMLVLLGATPVDAYDAKEEVVEVEHSRDEDVTRLPSTVILYDSEMKRKIEVKSTKEMMKIVKGIQKASPVKEEWTKGKKLGTLDFGVEELVHIYYGDEREKVFLLVDEETMFMSRKAFFDLFSPSVHTRPLPPGEGGEVQPLPPGQSVQPDDFLPL
ncbi:hypothetical protein GLV98_11065 [Halobacillus litoralis]|uniref:Uncharacterized protein n=1 Tax=Halobacillus litoralis TaxID=45668 RepID=A0A845EFN5_9BACI|nr:hypothetical protein [Halobacillus litoralis]MYL50028.1 hypothetical protein [Halobacillus litoralis]